MWSVSPSTWNALILAALTAIVVSLIVTAIDRFTRISVLTAFISAIAVSTVVLVTIDLFDVDGDPVLYMVPALFIFIPGYVLSVSMFEMAKGSVSVGAVQFVYATFGLLLLFAGVVLGAAATGTPVSALFAPALPAEFPYIVLWLGWIVFALGFTLAFSAQMNQFGWILLVTMVASATQQLGTVLIGEIVGTYLAAIVMVGSAILLSRNPERAPAIVLGLSGFYVLTVGSLGLEGITAFATGNQVTGFTDVLKMLTIGMAIALGMLTAVALKSTIRK